PGMIPAAPPARMLPTPMELLLALRRRWLVAGFLGSLAAVAAAAAVWTAMPTGKHQVRALLQLKPASAVLGKGTTDQDFDSFKQNQTILIKTRFLLNRVLRRPKVAELAFVRTIEDPARWLEDNIRLKWESPEILAVMMNGNDPAQLKIVLDTLLAEYVDDAKSDDAKTRDGKIKSLEVSKTDLSKRIAAIESNLQKLQSLGGELGPTPATTAVMVNLYTQELSRVVADTGKLQSLIRAEDTARETLERGLAAAADAPVDPDAVRQSALASPDIRPRAEAVVKAEAAFQQSAAKLVPGTPLLTRLKADVAKAEQDFQKAVDELQPELVTATRTARKKEITARLTGTTEKLKSLRQEVADNDAHRRILTDKIFAANRAGLNGFLEMDELKALRDKRDTINRELLQLDFEQRADSRVQLREEAVVSLNQNLQKKLIFAAAGGAAGFAGTVLIVGFLEWRARRVDSVEQVITELSMRVIGAIPAFPSRQAVSGGDVGRDQAWRFVLNESVNSTRTMLLHAARAQAMQVLAVTSAAPGEGKTSVASQLATSIAAAGLRTLLIDGDLRNPSLHLLFEAPAAPGCCEVLTQEVDVPAAVQPTAVPNLWLMPAGQCSYRALAALAHGHPLEALFRRVRGQFDFVVVDTGPVLPVADALLIGQHVDGVILSIMRDVSQLPKVRSAAEKMMMLGIPLLGAVVNGVTPDLRGYGRDSLRQLPA
ncbi:MAG: polysaccharide biosynthesis tyrosine autokinase, partial [Fimbriiglobus sp.]